jgi:hypothetical protein
MLLIGVLVGGGAGRQWLAGKSFGFPSPGNLILYEFEEWQGVMSAVREAQNAFTCIELGAGWPPWLVASSFAAMQRGITDLCLIGVEANQNNILNMESHFRDNGLANSYHRFIHAAIDDHDAEASEQHPEGAPLLSLYSLLKSYRIVNVIHCDIQFAEARAFAAGMGILTEKVRWVVVETHSRTIEDNLIELFQKWGWLLEAETPCKYSITNGRASLLADGAQVWRNPRILTLTFGVKAEARAEAGRGAGLGCATPDLAIR